MKSIVVESEFKIFKASVRNMESLKRDGFDFCGEDGEGNYVYRRGREERKLKLSQTVKVDKTPSPEGNVISQPVI